jgi:hypothetical protein
MLLRRLLLISTKIYLGTLLRNVRYSVRLQCGTNYLSCQRHSLSPPLCRKSIRFKKRQLTLWTLPFCAATLQWRIEETRVLHRAVEFSQSEL